MNWIKRAFRSISYHKKNTILMFLSFLILSILILFGLCIRAASRERIWEIRTSIGGSVLVSNERQIYSEEPRGVNSIHIKNIWNSALMKEFGLAAVIR